MLELNARREPLRCLRLAAPPLPPAAPSMLAQPPTAAAHLVFGLPADTPTVSEDDGVAGSIVNEVFATAWRIARGDGYLPDDLLRPPVDQYFWQQVRIAAEQCRTHDDWQRLLAVLLGISLSPTLDKSPLYSFLVSPNAAAEHGLRPQRPSRRRRAEATALSGSSVCPRKRGPAALAREAIEARRTERRKSRRRLRALLDGAKERQPDEVRTLARWVLDDAEDVDAARITEREDLAAEMTEVTMGIMRAAKMAVARARAEGEASALIAKRDMPEVTVGGAGQDELRSGVVAGAAGITSGSSATLKPESEEVQARRVDEAESTGDIIALSRFLESDFESVAVKAALAIGSLCARDSGLQNALIACGGLPKIASLLDAPFSERGVIDLTLVFKALCAHEMHHPRLLEQFVRADGPQKVISSLAASGGGAIERQQALLEIIRSLCGHPPSRDAMIKAGVIPRLLRLLVPSSPINLANPAAAALAVLSFDPACAEVLLKAQALPALVQVFVRGPATDAAVSSAAAVSRIAALRPEASQRARDAGAIEAVLPLLDGGYSSNPPERAAAEVGATCLCTLIHGSKTGAAELLDLGGLQTLIGVLGQPDAPVKVKAAAIETAGVAAGLETGCRAELVRLGAPRILVACVADKSRKVASIAASTLTNMATLGDVQLSRAIAAAMTTGGGLPLLVEQLGSPDADVTARAARLLDGALIDDESSKRTLFEMSAVPKLIELLRHGPAAPGVEAALGAIEGIVEGTKEAQEQARHAGIFKLLPPLLDRSEASADVRVNALLALRACVHGNQGIIQAATDAGLVSQVAEQLDDGPDSESALLAVQALMSLGLRELHALEAIVRKTDTRNGTRVATLRNVWTTKPGLGD
eukprot:scaffold202002_cov28-Tisochrysis_lutea.AAC.2